MRRAIGNEDAGNNTSSEIHAKKIATLQSYIRDREIALRAIAHELCQRKAQGEIEELKKFIMFSQEAKRAFEEHVRTAQSLQAAFETANCTHTATKPNINQTRFKTSKPTQSKSKLPRSGQSRSKKYDKLNVNPGVKI